MDHTTQNNHIHFLLILIVPQQSYAHFYVDSATNQPSKPPHTNLRTNNHNRIPKPMFLVQQSQTLLIFLAQKTSFLPKNTIP